MVVAIILFLFCIFHPFFVFLFVRLVRIQEQKVVTGSISNTWIYVFTCICICIVFDYVFLFVFVILFGAGSEK